VEKQLGVWEQKSDSLWVYRRQGEALLYGCYVARHYGGTPDTASWRAVIGSPRVGSDTMIR
jgi:hypothetical protein